LLAAKGAIQLCRAVGPAELADIKVANALRSDGRSQHACLDHFNGPPAWGGALRDGSLASAPVAKGQVVKVTAE